MYQFECHEEEVGGSSGFTVTFASLLPGFLSWGQETKSSVCPSMLGVWGQSWRDEESGHYQGRRKCSRVCLLLGSSR